MSDTATCANCGRPFGALESPQRWRSESVCIECYDRLLRGGPKMMAVRRGVDIAVGTAVMIGLYFLARLLWWIAH